TVADLHLVILDLGAAGKTEMNHDLVAGVLLAGPGWQFAVRRDAPVGFDIEDQHLAAARYGHLPGRHIDQIPAADLHVSLDDFLRPFGLRGRCWLCCTCRASAAFRTAF